MKVRAIVGLLLTACATSPRSGECVAKSVLTVRLQEPGGKAVSNASVKIDPCCGASCPLVPTDATGSAVLEACPTEAGQVVVAVETNPRFYTYTPPRPLEICAEIEEATITVEPHPDPKYR